MTDPQTPSPWQNPDTAQQWQNPAGQYPVTPAPGQYQVSHVGQASFSMAPLAPVLPQELAPPRPATITAAMWIWIAGAVLAVAVIPVMLFANIDSIVADIQVDNSASERDAARLGVQIWAVMAGFGMLVAAAPYVAFAIVLRNGQNWARILLTVMGVLGFMSMIAIMLIGLQAPVWQAGVAICVVEIGLIIAAVVLQFLPASNKYVR